jgi:hypothetical protein
MQIEIDFDVFKALTVMRQDEADSYNSVLRRVLKLPNQNALLAAATGEFVNKVNAFASGDPPTNALAAHAQGREWDNVRNALLPQGAWFDNTFFPNGTRFRATYKGRTYTAEVRDGCWIDSDGLVRTSPSAAAGAISGTTVNGWRFWHGLMPGTSNWRRLDEFKS